MIQIPSRPNLDKEYTTIHSLRLKLNQIQSIFDLFLIDFNQFSIERLIKMTQILIKKLKQLISLTFLSNSITLNHLQSLSNYFWSFSIYFLSLSINFELFNLIHIQFNQFLCNNLIRFQKFRSKMSIKRQFKSNFKPNLGLSRFNNLIYYTVVF